MIAVVKQGQCLMDIAVQYSGDATGLFAIALINGFSVTEQLAIGTQIKIPDEAVNEEIKKWFAANGYVVATDNPEPGEPLQQEGIGYWRIGQDFVVS